MKELYVKRENIKELSKRQKYLTSSKKQENLLAFVKLGYKKEFKNRNKELIIEIPNEMKNKMDHDELLKFYLDKFIEKTGYEHVGGALHLNKSETNLHLHLSYVDRTKEVQEVELAKSDQYVYASTGKKLKKADYKEDNPNHLLIKKGEPLLDYSLVTRNKTIKWKDKLTNDNISRKDKFALRRDIVKTITDKMEPKTVYSNCLESGRGKQESLKVIEDYKDYFVKINNELLKEHGFRKKYYSVEQGKQLGNIKQMKIGKIVGEPNPIQKQNLLFNEMAKDYNTCKSALLWKELHLKNQIQELEDREAYTDDEYLKLKDNEYYLNDVEYVLDIFDDTSKNLNKAYTKQNFKDTDTDDEKQSKIAKAVKDKIDQLQNAIESAYKLFKDLQLRLELDKEKEYLDAYENELYGESTDLWDINIPEGGRVKYEENEDFLEYEIDLRDIGL